MAVKWVPQKQEKIERVGYVAGLIPAVTPGYCAITTINALRSTKKKQKLKNK
jgi:hypothetical protein